MTLTRRDLGKLALGAVPAAGWLFRTDRAFGAPVESWAVDAAQGKPNSRWAGVQVGMNVPYNFGEGNYVSGEEILKRCIQLNISGVELRMQPVELFMGSPEAIAAAATAARGRAARAGGVTTITLPDPAPATPGAPAAEGARRGGGGGGRGGRAPLTPEQEAAQKAAASDLSKWRVSAAMTKVKEFKKMYDDAGIAIEIVKVDGIFGFTDDVLDYTFTLVKNLGARAISTEISTAADRAAQFKRLGQFAEKHKTMVGFHGHTATGPLQFEEAFAGGPFNGANLDIGHFLGGNKTSPIPFLKQYHQRITHIHVKDKTLDDRNVPFGTGDTPIKEALQTIRDNKWNIQATIEFEYAVPQGSDRMAEMKKCVEFCKQCLV